MRVAAVLATLIAIASATACVDAGTRPAAIAASVDSADQVLAGFETAVTREGIRRARVTADTARLYEASQSLSLRRVRMTFFDAQGNERSQLTADSAQMFWSSNLVLAHGGVVLSAPNGKKLKSEFVRIDENAREISTDKPFTLESGSEFVRGTSLKTDPEFQNVVASKPSGSSGKAMDLPGQ